MSSLTHGAAVLGSVAVLAACRTGAPPSPGEVLVARGQEVFFGETFDGNGRTCGTCHRMEDNFGLTPGFIATLPGGFTLSQNYPNPFNPETTIHFDLPHSEEIELEVYNLAAQRVATLVRGYRDAGSYSVRWDGANDAGVGLATGVYFYRLTAGTRVQTKKLLLLR